MRTQVLGGVVAGACLLWTLSAANAQTPPSEEIHWGQSFPAAMTEAKSSGKLIMADFYADW